MATLWSVLSDLDLLIAKLANWLSLVSLLVSTFAAVTISTVRKEIGRRATLPSVISALEDSTRVMSSLLADFDANRRPFDLELARCEAKLRAIAKISKPTARRADVVIRNIADFRLERLPDRLSNQDRAWSIYASVNGLIEELKHTALIHQIGG